MAHQIYTIELHLNKANFCDIGAPILNLHLSMSNGIVVSKIDEKRDDFDFDIETSPCLDNNSLGLPDIVYTSPSVFVSLGYDLIFIT